MCTLPSCLLLMAPSAREAKRDQACILKGVDGNADGGEAEEAKECSKMPAAERFAKGQSKRVKGKTLKLLSLDLIVLVCLYFCFTHLNPQSLNSLLIVLSFLDNYEQFGPCCGEFKGRSSYGFKIGRSAQYR